jgi:nucleoside-diphosphate-sugar epimerase
LLIYISSQDARDGAQAVRKGLESSLTGHHAYIIANADSCFHAPTAELAAEHFKGVQLNAELLKDIDTKGEFKGVEGLLSCAKARRDFGFEPQWTWRNGGKEPWKGK